MKVLFTFENALPNRQADAEVFLSTARALSQRVAEARLLVPGARHELAWDGVLGIRRCAAPLRSAALRHLFMVVTLPLRPELRACDLVYTRHMWVAAVAVSCGRRVAFDHYRPWADQLPPLQPFLRWLLSHERMVVAICHSRLTRESYRRIGVPARKLVTVHAGYDPGPLERAKVHRMHGVHGVHGGDKRALGLSSTRPTALYTGRVNDRKGLDVLLAAARVAPEIDFVLVGAEDGRSRVERQARELPNVKLVAFQPASALAHYLCAADVLVIPPSSAPLDVHGSTVLPLKTFLYLGAGKPIVAGATADNSEVLRDGCNARLIAPDDPLALARALREITRDPALAQRLAAGAAQTARGRTWSARAERILSAITTRMSARRTGRLQGIPWLLECGRWLAHVARSGRWNLPRRAA